ncbi:MAG: PrsW family glutamic-type intramembrane protease [Candidatus Verstraetearchaeota archaeon]|nr:PrsW family glutamic-type intramembrane protease [Candidatus Verstraetearchaeota archaeon]
MSEIFDLLVILIASALPPLIYLVWVRGWEICNREELKDLYRALAVGATYTVFFAVIVSTVFNALFFGLFRMVIIVPIEMQADLALLTSVLVVAPLVEESIKMTGFRFILGKIKEVEDGMIYGMAIGFGFALTENVIYGWDQALAGGLVSGLALVAVRSALSSFLHASATAIAGLGVSRSLIANRGIVRLIDVVPYLAAAIGMHALFNFLSSSSLLFGSTAATGLLTLMLAPLVYLVLMRIRKYAALLDREGPCIVEK